MAASGAYCSYCDLLAGLRGRPLRTLRREIGVMFQDYATYQFSAADNIGIGNVELMTEQALIDFSREQLTGYKVPRQIHFVDELPRTATGKLAKMSLIEAARTSVPA